MTSVSLKCHCSVIKESDPYYYDSVYEIAI